MTPSQDRPDIEELINDILSVCDGGDFDLEKVLREYAKVAPANELSGDFESRSRFLFGAMLHDVSLILDARDNTPKSHFEGHVFAVVGRMFDAATREDLNLTRADLSRLRKE